MKDLHHPDVEQRFEASIQAAGPKVDSWPRGCWGAANGWLMLLGPSPGRQDSDADIWQGGPGRPMDSIATIGPQAGRVNYETNVGRNRRWNMLSEAIFGRLEYAHALTTVANLDWGHNPDHAQIPQRYLEQGCKVVFDVMQKSRPRVVVTLVRRTWDVFAPFVRANAETVPYSPRTGLDSLVFRIPGFEADTILIRSPQHPSRHFFTAHHAAMLAEETEGFLDQAR